MFHNRYCHGNYHFTVGTCYQVNGYQPGQTCEQQCGSYTSKVCGANGVTYNNPCLASCDHVYSYYAGACVAQCGENPLTYTFTKGLFSGDMEGQCGTQPYVFTATDPCGNSVDAAANFIIKDDTPPVIRPAQDRTVDCDAGDTDAGFLAWLNNMGGASAVDSCAGALAKPTMWLTPVIQGTQDPAIGGSWVTNGPDGLCGDPYVLGLTAQCKRVTFTARDNCGNTASTSAKYVRIDSTPPIVEIKVLTVDICVETSHHQNKAIRWANCQDGAPGPYNPNGASVGNCSYPGPQPVLDAIDSCDEPLVTTNLLNMPTLNQLIPRTGSQGPFLVKPPQVPAHWVGMTPAELPEDVFNYLKYHASGLSGLSRNDKCPRVSVMDIAVTDGTNQGVGGRAYHVYVDTTKPRWTTVPSDMTVECTRGNGNKRAFNAWLDSLGGGIATDDCLLFGDITTGIVGSRPVYPDGPLTQCPLEIHATFFVEDACGNRIQAQAKFVVRDTVKPVVPAVAPRTIECGLDGHVRRQLQNWVNDVLGYINATDDCCDDLRLSANIGDFQKSDGFPATCSNREAEAVITARDFCDNFDSTTLLFKVRDTKPPVFINAGKDLFYSCDPLCTNKNMFAKRLFQQWINTDVRGCVDAEDCQEDMSFTITGVPGDLNNLCGQSGTITVTATDACGNANSTTVDWEFADPSLATAAPTLPPAAPPCKCGDNSGNTFSSRPTQVEFIYTGGAPLADVGQEDKGFSSGATLTCSSVSVSCVGGKTGGLTVTPSTVALNGKFLVSTNQDTQTTCTLTCGSSVQTVSIHTSCSKPLFVGQDFGAIEVSNFPGSCGGSSPAPPPALPTPQECPLDWLDDVDVCDCVPSPAPPIPPPPPSPVCGSDGKTRPNTLTMRYVGGNQITNTQNGKATVSGSNNGGAATVVCQGTTAASNIAVGTTFQAPTQQATNTICAVSTASGTQTITIHTSCSQPLNAGDIFGSLQLVCVGDNCAGSSGGSGGAGGIIPCGVVPPPPPSPPITPCGCGGISGGTQISRPGPIAMTVNAGSPVGSLQDGKGGSTGSAIAASCTTVAVECHQDGGSSSWLPYQVVQLGATVTATAAGTQMECTVTCGSAVQTISMHTSCSKPLFAGQNFGALTIVGFPGQCGSSTPPPPPPPGTAPAPPPPSAVCDACAGASSRVWIEDYYAPEAKSSGGDSTKPKLSSVTVRYIQGYALTNSQEGKASVSPTTPASGPATITCNGGAAATVQPGGEYTFFVSGADSVCTVTSSGGTQTITIHTSCSKVINIGDIYGSLALIRMVRTDGTAFGESEFCPVAGSPTAPPTRAPSMSNPPAPPPYNPPPPPPPAYGGNSGCMYDSYCESNHYEGGQLKALRFRFVSANKNTFQNSQTYVAPPLATLSTVICCHSTPFKL